MNYYFVLNVKSLNADNLKSFPTSIELGDNTIFF